MVSGKATLERDRITARVSKDVRERLERAASTSGATLNQFVVQAAMEKADRILERETNHQALGHVIRNGCCV